MNSKFFNKKNIQFKIQDKILDLLEPVISTLGPNGKIVGINENNKVNFTKDGVTVMKSIKPKNEVESTIITAIKDACNKTNSMVGDGTTTTVCLLASILNQAIKYLSIQDSSNKLMEGIETALEWILEEIQKYKIQPDQNMLSHVATIAVNNDKKLGNIINQAINKIDPKYGLIHVEEGKGMKTELQISQGMQIKAGYISSYFTMHNNNSNILEMDNPSILLINGEINQQEILMNFLNDLNISNRPGLIICNKMDGSVLKFLLFNLYQNAVKKIAVVYNPENTPEDKLQLLKDISKFTGAKIVDRDINISDNNHQISNNDIGSCRSAKITSDNLTIFHSESNDKLDEEIKNIQLQITDLENQNEQQSNKYTKLQERYNRLTGKAAIIVVGAATNSEINEIKDRIYDAVSSVKSATQGVCYGGGLTLFNIQKILMQKVKNKDKLHREIEAGINIIINSLSAPLEQIIKNSNKNSFEILHQITNQENKQIGYDAINNAIVDTLEKGIIDSYQVTYHAINNAISIAKLLINTSFIIHNESKNNIGGMY